MLNDTIFTIGTFSEYNVPITLNTIQCSGQGKGEYSCASILSGKTNISELNQYISRYSDSHDITVDNKKYEVKQLISGEARIGVRGYPIVHQITCMLKNIYDILQKVADYGTMYTPSLNDHLTCAFGFNINFKDIVEIAHLKIAKRQFSRTFLGLNNLKEKLNLQDLIYNLIEWANKTEVPKSPTNLLVCKSFKRASNKLIIAALEERYSTKQCSLTELCEYINLQKLDDLYKDLIKLICNDTIDNVFDDIHGIFFIDAYKFLYVPKTDFKKYIEFSRISQVLKIRLNLSS